MPAARSWASPCAGPCRRQPPGTLQNRNPDDRIGILVKDTLIRCTQAAALALLVAGAAQAAGEHAGHGMSLPAASPPIGTPGAAARATPSPIRPRPPAPRPRAPPSWRAAMRSPSATA
ncbi:hypothetical protein G6F50_017586 [Rhizopus delemar]|uniref:Uncharacterized protein n=1 Tax=Rhizopus delemar TaxID=936053 RepID=A0A9P7BZZ8_9FUNG|nr:hypothetical protein G6F50_017586 [Rhizopus delemar]